MDEDFEITTISGKTYKSFRAYHIALGHAVRQALIEFSKEVELYCQRYVENFYGEYTPEYYERSYQLENKMKLGDLIKMSIKGNFEGKYQIEYELFDWEVLDSIDNGIGNFGTYMSFDKSDSRPEIEEYFRNGIIGHNSFDLYKEIDDYVNKNLDDRIDKVIKNMGVR